MGGLIWQETLTLTWGQHSALLFGFLGSMWLWRVGTTSRQFALGSFCGLLAMWSQSNEVWLCRDVTIPLLQHQALSAVPWRDFLTLVNQTTYLKLHPPLWAVWWRIVPSPFMMQACCVAWAWTGLLAYRAVYGHQSACWWLASPLFLLISCQPLNEVPLWWCAVVGSARGYPFAGLAMGSGWKALGYYWWPWAWWRSSARWKESLLVLGGHGLYWRWLWRHALGKRQARALCAWSTGHAVRFTGGRHVRKPRWWGLRLWRRVRRMSAATWWTWAWYLFPLWCEGGWAFWGYFGLILVGQGNIKYAWMLSLCLDKTQCIWYTTEHPVSIPLFVRSQRCQQHHPNH